MVQTTNNSQQTGEGFALRFHHEKVLRLGLGVASASDDLGLLWMSVSASPSWEIIMDVSIS